MTALRLTLWSLRSKRLEGRGGPSACLKKELASRRGCAAPQHEVLECARRNSRRDFPLLRAAVFLAAFTAIPACAQSPPGAAACSGCHQPAAREGAAIAPVNGLPRDHILAAMAEFKSGARQATVMGRIAKGFSDDEIARLADWFSGKR